MWQELEKKYGIAICQTIRSHIEEEVPYEGDDDIYIEDLRGIASERIELLIKWRDSSLLQGRQKTVSPNSEPKRRYRKSLERKSHLIDFVVTTTYRHKQRPMGRLFDITKLLRHDWKMLTAAWNKKHLYDPVTLPGLKARYYRAIREDPIELAFSLVYVVYPFLWKYMDQHNIGARVEMINFVVSLTKQPRKQPLTKYETDMPEQLERLNQGARD